MTKKRFTEIVSTQKVIDTLTGKEYSCLIDDELLELVNELHEENEQLKYSLSAHMVDLNNCKGKCSALEIESERLKQEVREYIKALNKTLEEREELWEENEQLKKQIEELKVDLKMAKIDGAIDRMAQRPIRW